MAFCHENGLVTIQGHRLQKWNGIGEVAVRMAERQRGGDLKS